ncbi:RNA polymerase sigma-70 factor (ECF subfamily) [Saonia flava]|uniref:RNA polymerase sigma-70 factor (ECF subfamily) n=1 Tax=Saonia flava TaxID=523696 RepID=A0A846R0M2_9FLAO|nr:RNA polymerase sigma-70 factor [Saonia flava]NJB70914.1 RNA polymerase sigma-70 factor (ECF subfamily) [Saonia flava]
MGNSFDDNQVLIKHLKKGDEKAYSYLLNNYHHRLCVYAHCLINDKDMAEDIVQNVFIRVWEKRNNLKTNFSIKSFLYKSVYNEFIDQNRKRKSVTFLEKKYIDALNTIVKEDTDVLEKLFNLVQKEIQALPPKCKMIFLLSKKEGLSNIEIAEHLDLSIKTIESHITKAFSIIREKLDSKVDVQTFLFLLFRTKGIKTTLH